MMERSAWPWMLIVAALLPGAECAAQSAPVASATTNPPPRAKSAAAVPASTVSPAIERFVKKSGLEFPAPTAMSAPVMPMTRQPIPSSSAPPRGLQDMPAALPAQPPSIPAPDVGERPNPLGGTAELAPAPFAPTDFRFPINLATALRLSDARPLIVAAAQASVWVAEANLTQAKLLWIPTLNFGADYLRHDGGGPDFNKGVMTAPSVNYFYAGGGLTGSVNLTDVIYQPLVARQTLNARHFDIQTAKNDAVLRTADAYFGVHQYRGTYAAMLYCVDRGRKLVEQISTLSRDLVPAVEVQRSQELLADLEQWSALARQQWRVQSANLTQVLRLDPRSVVEPMEHDHLQVTLIDPAKTLDELMPIALKNRPDLASRQAMIGAAGAAIQREKMRPFLPTVWLTGYQAPGGMLIQAGVFGLGPNSSLNQFTGREDVSVQLMWQLESLGIGNLARIKRQRGEQSQAIIDLRRAQDAVAADVNRALARVQSATSRVLQADRSVRTGLITYNGQVEGLSETRRTGDVLVLVNRPQEAVYALMLLHVAFDEYFTTVAEYNRAQFDLFHALGYPAREVTYLRPPGNIEPVETNRPRFLPPVGNGPPPATR